MGEHKFPKVNGEFIPKDIDDGTLEKMNHAEWLEEFSQMLALKTHVAMTPQRLGMITRLQWASRYVRLLEAKIISLEADASDVSGADVPEGR